MQKLGSSTQKPGRLNQKTIFSCNVYRTNTEKRLSLPPAVNFQSSSQSSTLNKPAELIYVNEKVTNKAKPRFKKLVQECSTQTSKTILQLAKLETGMAPDSLGGSPRDYSLANNYSDYTLDGSCHILDCLFCEKAPNKYSLTQAFLDKKQQNMKSKSFVDSYPHPNYIHEIRDIKQQPKKKSSRSLILPDNSNVRKISSLTPQSTFMAPTTASQIKSKMEDIRSTNYLIPQMRRGRSTSPKPSEDHRRFESSRKIPYIDQAKSDVSSSTTLINTRAKLKKMFDEDLLESDNSIGLLASETEWDRTNSTEAAVCSAVNRFRDLDWRTALKGLGDVVELCRLVDVDLVYDYMPSINQRLIELLKSPRSHVARTACQAAGHLFEYVKDTRRPEFDDIVDLLLHKTADSNKFIRHDANLALDCMVTHIPTFHSVRALCGRGPVHKNALVRGATVRLLICTVVIAGADCILNPSNNEFTRKRIILNMARFLEDVNLETRRLAERLYKVLGKETKFETYLKKYLPKEQIMKIKKTLKLVYKK